MKFDDVSPADLDWIGSALGNWSCSTRWSLRGRTPSPVVLDQLVWQNVNLQSVARTDGAVPFLLLQVAHVNHDSGFATLDFLADPACSSNWDGAMSEFLDRSFRDLPLRKLYVEVLADDFVAPESLSSVWRKAGSLKDHERRTATSYVALDLYEVWADAFR